MKFRKKPVVVEAIQYTGRNEEEVFEFFNASGDPPCSSSNREPDLSECWLMIETLEGVMYASAGDWIVRGVKGEFYPVQPDIFAETYEAVDD